MRAELTAGSAEERRQGQRQWGSQQAKTWSSKAACRLTAEVVPDTEGVPLSGHGPDGSSWPWHLVAYMQAVPWTTRLPGSSAQSWQRQRPCTVPAAAVVFVARQKAVWQLKEQFASLRVAKAGQGNKREIIRRRWDNRRIKGWTFYSCRREAELSGPTALDSSCGQGLRLAQSGAYKGPGIQKVLLSLPETYMETGIQKVPAKWRMKAGRDKEWWTSSRMTKVPISRAKGPSTSHCGEHLSPFPKLASFLFLLQGLWRRMFAFLWPSCFSRRWPKVSLSMVYCYYYHYHYLLLNL